MPHLSKKGLSASIENSIWDLFLKVLAHTSSIDKMHEVLGGLLTPTESLMLGKRLTAAILFNEGKTDSEIASQLNLTRPTVYKFRLEWERKPASAKVLKEAMTNKNLHEMASDVIMNLANYVVSSAGGRVPKSLPSRRKPLGI